MRAFLAITAFLVPAFVAGLTSTIAVDRIIIAITDETMTAVYSAEAQGAAFATIIFLAMSIMLPIMICMDDPSS